MTILKLQGQRVNYDIETFVGRPGTIFYGPDDGSFRLSDGVTPGGISLGVGGGSADGSYTLPTASTTVKGGVKVDGSTIGINNQVVSVLNGVFTTGSYSNPSWLTSLNYTKITNAPTIPTNTNQLTNGAGFITSSSLSGYATQSYVTGQGYITSSSLSWTNITGKPTFSTVATSGSYADLTNKPTLFSGSYTDLTNKPTVPTNTSQLNNDSNFITSSALTGYATETYVTTRGYLTSVSWNDVQNKPTFSTVATSGSYADLTNKPTLFSGSYTDLTNKPTIPTDISQLSDINNLLSQSGPGGTTYITNNIENPYSFSVAGDDSVLIEILNGETLKFSGSNGITIITDSEGKITITGPDLSDYATETYVTTRGYLTSVDYGIITNTPNLSAVATSGSYTDLTNKPTLFSGSYTDLTNKPSIPTSVSALTNDSGFITSSALTGYATETYVTTRGYLTSVDYGIITNTPILSLVATSGSYTDLLNLPTLFSGSYNDLTNKPFIPDISSITFTGTIIDSADSSRIIFTPSVSFSSDVIIENDLIVTNQVKNLNGELYATESFVQRAVTELIGAAPETLNTLQELAEALGNDQNFATTILNALSSATSGVRYDTDDQGLTEQQQTNARTNINAASSNDLYAAALIMG